ncbi:MAG TPA: TIGR01458 family HAD-type hydrolase [Thermoanaerobaculia bacterium]|jgi:HAD superfamily hydrolase (TIGR01458 family)|nr:TIGR01458 family HAD-type hydrolase [Thermoanaerobaculia bacterium]
MSGLGRCVQGLLFDLDGTVYQEGRAIPGAAEALEALRRRGLPFRFTTNTTRRPRAALAERLRSMGISARPEEILSAPAAAARWLRSRGVSRVQLLLAEATFEEFAGFEIAGRSPEVVVVGDLGEDWTFPLLNQAFRNLMDGADLLAIQRNRYWHTDGGLSLDAGPFVAALEYGSGKTATLVGKPSPAFFEAAARELGVPPGRIAVVGDDLESDVAGARASGMIGVAVRTGKYRPQDEERAQQAADVVLDSLAAVPGWIGG